MTANIRNEFLTVTVADRGAELQSIRGADGTEYLWQGDARYWPDRALNLFPYVARLTRGSYYLDGHLGHMDIHGLAPYADFRLLPLGGTELVCELTSDERTYAAYPRRFAFRVRYRLRGDTLAISYEVENRDRRTMYFGLGGHPGFNVPLAAGRSFADYRLRFGERCAPVRVGFTDDCFLDGTAEAFPLLDGAVLPLRHDLFDRDAIVLRDMARSVTLETDGDGHAITVAFPQMPYLGLWHMPETDAPYLCIEPWCSLPSSQGRVAILEEQEDLLRLPAGETYRNEWTIQLHGLKGA